MYTFLYCFALICCDISSHNIHIVCIRPFIYFTFIVIAFVLPEAQVVILGGVDRVAKGESIYAVYPDTTSFYQATVVQIPKKSPNGELCCMVHFKDDGDEHGVTHEKPVLMKHVMRLPTV